MKIKNRSYVVGQDRNESTVVAHLYRGTFNNLGNPMCRRGWNRSSGFGYSIFRNFPSGELCKVCLRRAAKKLLPVKPVERKNKWL